MLNVLNVAKNGASKMNCKKCGGEIVSGVVLCRHCGSRIVYNYGLWHLGNFILVGFFFLLLAGLLIDPIFCGAISVVGMMVGYALRGRA